jgi:hypothetical protein
MVQVLAIVCALATPCDLKRSIWNQTALGMGQTARELCAELRKMAPKGHFRCMARSIDERSVFPVEPPKPSERGIDSHRGVSYRIIVSPC